jgi:hypothetical protein
MGRQIMWAVVGICALIAWTFFAFFCVAGVAVALGSCAVATRAIRLVRALR